MHAASLHGPLGAGQALGGSSQMPNAQAAPATHWPPGSHDVPFDLYSAAQPPVRASQMPLVHGLPSSQAVPGRGVTLQLAVPSHSRIADSSLMQVTVAPAQVPLALQASPKVHSMPSLQVAPTGLIGLLHAPVLSLHTPGS